MFLAQATCGGCHMVVLARPREGNSGDVTLEEDDVTEDHLEKPYVELLGDTADSSALQRSLSARVRRRERVGGCRGGLSNAVTLQEAANHMALPAGEISGPVWDRVQHAARGDARLPAPAAAHLGPDHPATAASA